MDDPLFNMDGPRFKMTEPLFKMTDPLRQMLKRLKEDILHERQQLLLWEQQGRGDNIISALIRFYQKIGETLLVMVEPMHFQELTFLGRLIEMRDTFRDKVIETLMILGEIADAA